MADELKEAFKVFDRDQDGFISANEVNMPAITFLLATFGLNIIQN